MVERETQLEQDAALDDSPGQLRVARVSPDRAEQNRVVLLQRVQVAVIEDVAGCEEVTGTKRVLRDRGIHPGRCKNLEGFGGHLRADSVAGDDCK